MSASMMVQVACPPALSCCTKQLFLVTRTTLRMKKNLTNRKNHPLDEAFGHAIEVEMAD